MIKTNISTSLITNYDSTFHVVFQFVEVDGCSLSPETLVALGKGKLKIKVRDTLCYGWISYSLSIFPSKIKTVYICKSCNYKVGIYRIVLCHLWKQIIYHKRWNISWKVWSSWTHPINVLIFALFGEAPVFIIYKVKFRPRIERTFHFNQEFGVGENSKKNKNCIICL